MILMRILLATGMSTTQRSDFLLFAPLELAVSLWKASALLPDGL